MENLGICYKCMRTCFVVRSVCGTRQRIGHGWDHWEDFCRKMDDKTNRTKPSELMLKWYYSKKQNT